MPDNQMPQEDEPQTIQPQALTAAEKPRAMQRKPKRTLAQHLDPKDNLLLEMLLGEPSLMQSERAARVGLHPVNVSHRETRPLFQIELTRRTGIAISKAAASLPAWIQKAVHTGGETKQLAARISGALGLLREERERLQRLAPAPSTAPSVAIALQVINQLPEADRVRLQSVSSDEMAALIRSRAVDAEIEPGPEKAAK